MSQIDSPNIPEQVEASARSSADVLFIAKQNRLTLISKVSNPQLQELAQAELDELETLEAEFNWEKLFAQQAHIEFKSDIDALILLQEKFWALNGFNRFANFLTSWSLSSNELEAFYDMLNNQQVEDDWEELLSQFEFDGFPLARENYQVFAEKFGIKTSLDLNEKFDGQNKSLLLNAIPSLQSISWNPEVQHLVSMLGKLRTLEWTDAQTQMQEISVYLVGADGESGNLGTILTALKEQDAENAANGNPTKYFETFTRTVRDFSPDVSKRIDTFISTFDSETANTGTSAASYKKAVIAGAIPSSSKIETGSNDNISATLPDGTNIRLQIDGDQIVRSMNLQGSDVSVKTPLLPADFSKALGEYETIRQDLAPKTQHCEQALTFLHNPQFADVPLAYMQVGLRKTLGYTLHSKLNVSSITDKQQLTSLLQSTLTEFTDKLEAAEKTFNAALNRAVAKNQERYREKDEKIKTTLRAVKNSGLGLLDVSYLTSQISAGLTGVDIGVPVEIQNYDLASSNFWEPQSVTNNPSMHIEYIYRTANKILTGTPDGMVDGKLVWFSIEQAILNPDVAQKTDGELKSLLSGSGVWDETMGVNKAKMLAQLAKSVLPAVG